MAMNTILFYLNGKRYEVGEKEAFLTVSDFLRYERSLTGTKVVCAEGDCGACTVLLARYQSGRLGPYRAMNSCIAFVHSLNACHLITVEGLKGDGSKAEDRLHPIQEAMAEGHGAQCGFCTPGFICSLAGMIEDAKKEGFAIDEKRARNYTTGNLCRCTGYDPILKSACSVNPIQVKGFQEMYDPSKMMQEFGERAGQSIRISNANESVFLPATLQEAFSEKAKTAGLRVGSGATDLGVVSNKGRLKPAPLMTLHQVSSLYEIKNQSDSIWVGARVSLSDLQAAALNDFPEFVKMLHIFASPQIKNSGTLVGNLMNASPIADTIPFLRVAEAKVVLGSILGEREVNLNDFIQPGYKTLDVKPDEIVVAVRIPKSTHRYKLYKASTRKDLDISTVTFAARYRLHHDELEDFSLALGGVGPSVLRFPRLEAKIRGQKLTLSLFQGLASEIRKEITPLTDVRGSSEFRHQLVHNLILKFYDEVSREAGVGSMEASI